MYNEIKLWVENILGQDYEYSKGPWVEKKSSGQYTGLVCAIFAMGGAGVDMDIRKPRFKVMLVGERQKREDVNRLLTDIDNLIQLAMDSNPPCGAATIRAVTEPTGPGYTTENRAWVSVDFQIIY